MTLSCGPLWVAVRCQAALVPRRVKRNWRRPKRHFTSLTGDQRPAALDVGIDSTDAEVSIMPRSLLDQYLVMTNVG